MNFAIDQLSVTAAPFANHLKSKDFFDAATYPTAKFVSTKVVATGDKATITGDLTLKGVHQARRAPGDLYRRRREPDEQED